ncbi:MAG: type VI secretion system baseplate subunit TssE [Blastocatellia bacterium]|nr:type VI secretion system baseplate subunit TssE [Blastocatellia bacterium]MBL8193173.1 type VI secretion system baseplate subunit TssE [Blastocatellia bacterium]MBN8724730.1 type VI secretion system baseplate subunit TssE [Acidobacteriota bacterium]
MSRFDSEIHITPSVIDRLLDDEPELTQEALASRSRSLQQFKQAVKRDLEWLLNTRQTLKISDELKELSHSIANYGLPDLSNVNVKSVNEQHKLEQLLEKIIKIFEPRLEDTLVKLEPVLENEPALHFRIDAKLKVEPAPELVSFDTVLRLDSGRYLVKEG